MKKKIVDSIKIFLVTSISVLSHGKMYASPQTGLKLEKIFWLNQLKLGTIFAQSKKKDLEWETLINDLYLGSVKELYFPINNFSYIYGKKFTIYPELISPRYHAMAYSNYLYSVYKTKRNNSQNNKLLFKVRSYTQGSAPGETLEEGIENGVIFKIPVNDIFVSIEIIYGKDPDHNYNDPVPEVESELYLGIQNPLDEDKE